MSADVDPAEVMAAMLREALPGFATRIDPATDAVVIRGALPIAASMGIDRDVFYPVMRSVFEPPLARAFRDVTEDDRARASREHLERERQTEALRHELAVPVERIVDQIRTFAITAVNLDEKIRLEIQRARHEASIEAFANGKREGIEEGRREMIRMWQEAARESRADRAFDHGDDDD